MSSATEICTVSIGLFERGFVRAALNTLQRGIDRFPDAARLWEMLGIMQHAEGDFPAAEFALEDLDALAPRVGSIADGWEVRRKGLERELIRELEGYRAEREAQAEQLRKEAAARYRDLAEIMTAPPLRRFCLRRATAGSP